MRISDWSSDVCSSDLVEELPLARAREVRHQRLDPAMMRGRHLVEQVPTFLGESHNRRSAVVGIDGRHDKFLSLKLTDDRGDIALRDKQRRSEEHTSELQSLMRISYAVFCLKKKK